MQARNAQESQDLHERARHSGAEREKSCAYGAEGGAQEGAEEHEDGA